MNSRAGLHKTAKEVVRLLILLGITMNVFVRFSKERVTMVVVGEKGGSHPEQVTHCLSYLISKVFNEHSDGSYVRHVTDWLASIISSTLCSET